MTDEETQWTDLEAAHRAVRVARRRRVDERGAFDQFCKRVERLSTGGDQPDLAPDANCAVACVDETAGADPRAIRRAYEQTVMAVPHYADVYDVPYSEHVATELGHDVADALRRAGTLTPRLQERVLDATSAAHGRRVDAIRTLDAERAALEAAQQTVTDVLDAVDGDHDDIERTRLDALRDRCLGLVRRRRAHRREHDLVRDEEPAWVAPRSLVAPRLSTLYADLPVRDPVLAVAELLVEQLPGECAVAVRNGPDQAEP